MQISIKEALENECWHDFYNKDGNQGPYKFRLTSFNKIDLGDHNIDTVFGDGDKKEFCEFWLLKLDIVPLVSNCFQTSANISNDISISDSNGNTYTAGYDKPSFDDPSICEAMSLHKYNFSIKIPNCKFQASLLFRLPKSEYYFINYNETPKLWYKNENKYDKTKHNNEVSIIDAVESDCWYSCQFSNSPDLDIRIQFIGFDQLPLSQALDATKDDKPFYCGYYNLEDCEFISLAIKAVNYSKGDNNEVGGYLLGRLILIDDASLYYAASGTAGGSFNIDFTSEILADHALMQPLTPKIVYDANVVFLVAKNISSLSLGLRYGTLSKI